MSYDTVLFNETKKADTFNRLLSVPYSTKPPDRLSILLYSVYLLV
jgi:hypothetical protein